MARAQDGRAVGLGREGIVGMRGATVVLGSAYIASLCTCIYVKTEYGAVWAAVRYADGAGKPLAASAAASSVVLQQ